MNWTTFFQGLAAAAIGGATAGVTQAVSTTGKVDKSTLPVAGVGALIAVLAFLKQSPIISQPTPQAPESEKAVSGR